MQHSKFGGISEACDEIAMKIIVVPVHTKQALAAKRSVIRRSEFGDHAVITTILRVGAAST